MGVFRGRCPCRLDDTCVSASEQNRTVDLRVRTESLAFKLRMRRRGPEESRTPTSSGKSRVCPITSRARYLFFRGVRPSRTGRHRPMGYNHLRVPPALRTPETTALKRKKPPPGNPGWPRERDPPRSGVLDVPPERPAGAPRGLPELGGFDEHDPTVRATRGGVKKKTAAAMLWWAGTSRSRGSALRMPPGHSASRRGQAGAPG